MKLFSSQTTDSDRSELVDLFVYYSRMLCTVVSNTFVVTTMVNNYCWILHPYRP